MDATLIIRRIDGKELLHDKRDRRNFAEVLSYLPANDADTRHFVAGCRAVAYRIDMQPFKATVSLRIYEGTAKQCAEHICRYFDVYLRLRYSLTGGQTRYMIV